MRFAKPDFLRALVITVIALMASTRAHAAELIVCSFNIQFLGTFSNRDHEGLAKLLKVEKCDIVAIQELVAPPSDKFLSRNHLSPFPRYPAELYALLPEADRRVLPPLAELRAWPLPPGCIEATVPECYPKDTRPMKPALQSTIFFDAMEKAGFADFVLSPEDTGPKSNHNNGTSSEYFVTFFNPKRIKLAPDLPHGFLEEKRVGSGRDFARTPFAFPFRTINDKFDFTLISTHLTPAKSGEKLREIELKGISKWIADNSSREKDHIVIGDMNIESSVELAKVSKLGPSGPEGWASLNKACAVTNTISTVESRKPYDQVIMDRAHTSEVEVPSVIRRAGKDIPNFQVIDLKAKFSARWSKLNPGVPYPGAMPGYKHDAFRTTYSDHNPVKFRIRTPSEDDDAS